jgi:hypothetical protein
LTIFKLINYNQQMTTMGCMVDHIDLYKKYIQHTLPKRNNMQLFIIYSFWLWLCAYICKSFSLSYTKRKGLVFIFLNWFSSHTRSSKWVGDFSHLIDY